MKAWKVWAGACLLLLGAAAVLPAQGLYVLGGIGGKDIYDEGVTSYYGASNWGIQDVGVGDGALSIGWRFPCLMAVEASLTEDGGQTYQGVITSVNTDDYFSSTLNINPMTTLAVGPVFCWDFPSWWYGQTQTLEFGLKLEYSGISGNETVAGPDPGSQDFNGSTLGFGLFVRDLSVWTRGGFSLGLEAGWDYDYFNSLTVSNAGGAFASADGQTLNQYGGQSAYLDNSGGYVRLVIGWTQHPRRFAPPPVYHRRWRRRYYDEGYEDGGAGQPDDGAPGDTIPSQPQPTPQAAPPASPQQTYPASQNYGD